MFGLKKNIINQINCVFEEFPQINEVMIYGSRAKGDFKPGSDIDLSLKGDVLNHNIVSSICLKLDELYLPYIFDISIFSMIENEDLIEHIKRVGVNIYEKEKITVP